MKYVGDTCTGCGVYKPYVKYIPVNISEDICSSCFNVFPKHIPEEQHMKYLKYLKEKYNG